jgi:hypothetical protein
MDLEGIDKISVNIVTGSLVIYYDPNRIQPEQLVDFLRENNLFDETNVPKRNKHIHRAVSNTSERLGKAIFGWCVGRILDANGLSFLAALI